MCTLTNIIGVATALYMDFVNLEWKSYLRFFNWMLSEPKLLDHVGLNSIVIFLRRGGRKFIFSLVLGLFT